MADPRAVRHPGIYRAGCAAMAFGGCRARQGINLHVAVVQDVGAGTWMDG